MTGRPTKLTDELQSAIVADVKLGVPAETAAQAHGIVRSTFYLWMQQGSRETNTPHAIFSDAIKSARAEGEATLFKCAASGAKGWQSAAWALERRWPERYSTDRRIKNENVKALRAVPKLEELERQVNEMQARLNGERQPAQEDRSTPSEAPCDPSSEDDTSLGDGED